MVECSVFPVGLRIVDYGGQLDECENRPLPLRVPSSWPEIVPASISVLGGNRPIHRRIPSAKQPRW